MKYLNIISIIITIIITIISIIITIIITIISIIIAIIIVLIISGNMDFEIRSIFDLSTYDNQAVEEINDVFNRKKDLIAMLAYDNNEQHDNHNSPSKSSSLRGTQSPTRNNSGIILTVTF